MLFMDCVIQIYLIFLILIISCTLDKSTSRISKRFNYLIWKFGIPHQDSFHSRETTIIIFICRFDKSMNPWICVDSSAAKIVLHFRQCVSRNNSDILASKRNRKFMNNTNRTQVQLFQSDHRQDDNNTVVILLTWTIRNDVIS